MQSDVAYLCAANLNMQLEQHRSAAFLALKNGPQDFVVVCVRLADQLAKAMPLNAQVIVRRGAHAIKGLPRTTAHWMGRNSRQQAHRFGRYVHLACAAR